MLVSGNPGSGKSTLTAELLRRGVHAVDADGLAAWMDADGNVVGDDSHPISAEFLDTHHWGWTAPAVDRVVADLGPRGILLGIAVNQWDFVHRFDPLVLLELDEETQRRRVATRDPLVQRQIHAGLPVFQAQMIERGAVRLDASRPTAEIADAVLSLLDTDA
jgi:dephospho-CoA kinase